jgi:hypothetical protein
MFRSMDFFKGKTRPMTKFALLFSMAAFCVGAWLAIGRPPAERQPDTTSRTGPSTSSERLGTESVLAARQEGTHGLRTERYQHQAEPAFDPMLVTGLGEFTDEEIERYNRLHVLPFNPAIGRDCEDRPDPQFPERSYTSCTTVRERPAHPYSELDDEALLSLAEHDATAALILGHRVAGEHERLFWYLRAAALSEKSGPLMALAEQRYRVTMDLRLVEGELRRVRRPDRIAVRVALDTVAGRMGDPRANPESWRELLRSLAADRASTYLAQADALVVEFLNAMARTQREITGSVQIQEIIDDV